MSAPAFLQCGVTGPACTAAPVMKVDASAVSGTVSLLLR